MFVAGASWIRLHWLRVGSVKSSCSSRWDRSDFLQEEVDLKRLSVGLAGCGQTFCGRDSALICGYEQDSSLRELMGLFRIPFGSRSFLSSVLQVKLIKDGLRTDRSRPRKL